MLISQSLVDGLNQRIEAPVEALFSGQAQYIGYLISQ
jgi:hypothetical protein